MGLFKKILGKKKSREDQVHTQKEILRRCHFEVMEERRVLTANPVVAGVTYLEGDAGLDTAPDYFEVTFEGGAETTELTQFTINGDQDFSGNQSLGDVFFHANQGQVGAGTAHPFEFQADSSSGVTESDILGVNVSDDGLTLTVDVQNFEAGDVLAFTIDVDEVETLRPDFIASGVEFEGSLFNTTFVDENYTFNPTDLTATTTIDGGFVQGQTEGIFYDNYDQLLSEGEAFSGGLLDLVRDNENAQANRSAGAVDAFELEVKPITISGTVFHDENLSWVQEDNEDGIGGVTIELQQLNDAGVYETVATTQTDANGDYSFGEELGLPPGEYQLVETQPDGFLDVGATAGTVEGAEVGDVENVNVISNISIPLGGTDGVDYDFKEIRPASIEGNVFHDENNNGVFDPGEEGIADVLIQVTRVGAKPGVEVDAFPDTDPFFVRTDANGHYSVDALPPGVYQVVEINDEARSAEALAPFIDGRDAVGTVGGTTNGTLSNDRFTEIHLCADDHGVNYDFGEITPASIGGNVGANTPDGKVGIPDVTIQLLDADGNLVAETLTDENGDYEFDGLAPGSYSVVEVQPEGFIDADESLGSVGGSAVGSATNDRFTNIVLGSGDQAVDYDFCEHTPSSLGGNVGANTPDGGKVGIPDVTIQLFDADGNLVAETLTDENGDYEFTDLAPGDYSIVEQQPDGFVDAEESLGSIRGLEVGTITNDRFTNIVLGAGEHGVNYDFCEHLPASLWGRVFHDANDNGVLEAGEDRISDVEIQLTDENGSLVATTFTNDEGEYHFEDLAPGHYTITEIQPTDFIDGQDSLGSVRDINGNTEVSGEQANDTFTVWLDSGDTGFNYDFGELQPTSLWGRVWHDANNNGVLEAGEDRISDVEIQLTDENGSLVATTFTNDEGEYHFEDLAPGHYTITEIQPTDFIDGQESLGSVRDVNGNTNVSGEQANDSFTVWLDSGDTGFNYDFGELQPASLWGTVWVDANDDGVLEAGEDRISGVEIQLTDENGRLVATTFTNDDGEYHFEDLLPGHYTITEIQPTDFFDGQESLGSVTDVNGNTNVSGEQANDTFTVWLNSGDTGFNYDFGELLPAELHGRVFQDGPAFETADGNVPDDFRSQRDGIFQASTDTPLEGVRVELYYFIDPDSDSIAPRAVTLADVQAEFYDHVGDDPNAVIFTETDANGEYWFQGLQSGNYIVVEVQPDGFVDSNDTPGTTTGFTFNDGTTQAQSELINTFTDTQLMDSVVNIFVAPGGVSLQNNFSEVLAVQSAELPNDPDTTPIRPPALGNPITPRPGIAGLPGLFGSQPGNFTQFIGSSPGGGFQIAAQQPPGGSEAFSWHLSVINGGSPRAVGEADLEGSPWLQASAVLDTDWTSFEMEQATWSFTDSVTAEGEVLRSERLSHTFGMLGGIPLAGDFDGDGIDEVAIFHDGYWLIDINRNGRWDAEDLLAHLGDSEDQPVVGDWDGDGKDDIGIYGPVWERDPEAISKEPGLPNPDNQIAGKHKNIPPTNADSTTGARYMKLSAYGKQRADVIDHVFGLDDHERIAVTGDWNGNGIRSIGTFENGQWKLDVNGDGEFDYADTYASFGRTGDVPVVGDWDGDGIEQIAIYRSGTWIVDSNQNHQIDATDLTFQHGGESDQPVVGDWDGDGRDEPALFSNTQSYNNLQ